MLLNNLFAVVEIIKILLLACSGSIAIFGCSLQSKEDNSIFIKSYRLTSSLPVLDANGTYQKFDDTLTLIYYNNLVLYRIPILKSFSRITINNSGDIVNDMLERIETKYKYLVYKPGNSSGLIYNSSTERNPTKAKVDSFFKSNTATDFEKFYLKKSKNDSLVETYQDKSAGYFQEKYIPKKRPDPSFSDTTYLSYSSSIGEIDFSFSREMDKKMAKKLVQIRIIYLSKRHGQNIMPVVERELLFKLEKIGLSEEEFFSIRKIIDMAEFDLLQKK